MALVVITPATVDMSKEHNLEEFLNLFGNGYITTGEWECSYAIVSVPAPRPLMPKGFSRKYLGELWENSFWLPNFSTLAKDNSESIVVDGRMHMGQRYPTFIINHTDILILREILIKAKILQRKPKSTEELLSVLHHCSRLVQYFLFTDVFVNVCRKHEWKTFDSISDIWRRQCLNVNHLQDFLTFNPPCRSIPLNVSMLAFLFGDCREHNILLHVFAKIALQEFQMEDDFLISSVYTIGAKGLDGTFNTEHVFPVIWDLKNESAFALDALKHRSLFLPYPSVENQTGSEIIGHVMSDKIRASADSLPSSVRRSTHDTIYETGFYYSQDCSGKRDLPYLVYPVNFSHMMCSGITQFPYFKDHFIVYGFRIKHERETVLKVVSRATDKAFQKKRKEALVRGEICRPNSTETTFAFSPFQEDES